MTDAKLITDIKELLLEMKDEEQTCRREATEQPEKAEHFNAYSSAISLYRVRLETILEANNHTRPTTIDV